MNRPPAPQSDITAAKQRFPRAAGVVVPLFSLRNAHDAGTGEILDLIPFIDWLRRWRQRIVQLLPINETAPGEGSPYGTLSVFAIDPTYIAAFRVPEVEHSSAAQEWLRCERVQRRLRRWRQSPVRERRAVYAFKRRLLEFGFDEFTATAPAERVRRCAAFCTRNAWWLDDYALFVALKERRRWRSWETWPELLRRRDPQALARAATKLRPRIRFFQYVQWIAAEQWGAVRAHAGKCGVLVKGDLPFVCGRDSADVWAHQDLFDPSSSAGAPPDDFSTTGQAWGLPLYNWPALRRTGYQWWRKRARQAAELYDLFRVDHVVGLYRTYAIPVREGGTSGFVPGQENEQRAQGHELMSAILEEAGDTGVTAEDLGTVPDWVRASLTELGIPGYKVLRWEQRDRTYIDPRTYPALSIATTGTHDTDTLVAWWEGLRVDERAAVTRSLGLVDALAPDDAAPWTPELHLALLRRLYQAGSLLAILPIQDLFGWSERVNTPATTDRQNWTYRLPLDTQDLDRVPAIRGRMELIRQMTERTGRHPRATPE